MPANVLALLAAFTFALSSVLQQRATMDTQAAEGDPNFLKEVICKPVWLLGDDNFRSLARSRFDTADRAD